MVASARSRPAEGWITWLAGAALVLVVLVPNLWIAYGGSSPGPVAGAVTNSASATLVGNEKISFAPGDLHVGNLVVCENNGVRVGVEVPRPGRTASRHLQSAAGVFGATIELATRPDGAVIARCAE